jgi:hypothetical protein
MIGRRGFLIGGGLLLAMLAVVRAESLMPVHALRPVDFQLVDLLRGTQVDIAIDRRADIFRHMVWALARQPVKALREPGRYEFRASDRIRRDMDVQATRGRSVFRFAGDVLPEDSVGTFRGVPIRLVAVKG